MANKDKALPPTPIMPDESRVTLTAEESQEKQAMLESAEASNTQEKLSASTSAVKQAQVQQVLQAH